MSLHKVFVYGTLKTGEPNHGELSDAEGYQKLVGEAVTSEKYPLILGTKYNIPFLLYQPGTGHNVRGELYEVDDKVLAALDELEDHPNFYVREEIEVMATTNSSTHKAWIYFMKNFKKDLLKNEMLQCYTNNGSLPKYEERHLRKEANYKFDIYTNVKCFGSSEEATLEDFNNS